MENNLKNPIVISIEKNIFNEDQLNLSEAFKAFNQEDFKHIKLEDFLKANLPKHLKNFKKINFSENIYRGINSKRETKKLIRILESM